MAVTYAQVRDWVLALPGTREVMVEQWGHPTLRVGDKMIAGGAPDSPTMSVKATREEQAELIAAAPQTYAVAEYVGRHGWVRVDLASADAEELHQVVVEAWRRTAPKKLVKEYDSAQG
ncbi:MmcQ/YjbR family DNA-binding protein [Krasilnikovia sp. MM14-A1004]|uniref:MmcQ/YjbR family DNA-binding protein n=1 Tax=Krasilnikovia sp. MM14-A1004 TaxID=3373541 RepID=UPI00399CD3ED